MHKPDIFSPVVPVERLHPSFAALRESPGYAPARQLISNVWAEFVDKDGNFLQQSQTSGFDARLWELFLFASFWDVGAEFDWSHPAPDFLLKYGGRSFSVEAVTVNPTSVGGHVLHADSVDEGTRREHAYPIKCGSALFSKLSKRYWDLPHVAGRPLVLAIQDFHEPHSLFRSGVSLWQYLYGLRGDWHMDENGELTIKQMAVSEHVHERKRIPSRFFGLADTENISAVLFANSGTVAKFNRLGFLLGYGRDRIAQMTRVGLRYDPDPNQPNPLPFFYQVGDPTAPMENWGQGTSLFHNPNALHPLPLGLLPFPYHHLDGGVLRSFLPDFHPFVSQTVTVITK